MVAMADEILADLNAPLPDGQKPTWKYAEKLPPARANQPWMPGVKKLSYTHEALIDLMLTHPELDQNQYAAAFGYSATWTSLIMQSDAFREAVAARKAQLINPQLLATIDEKFKMLVNRSLDVLQEKLRPEMAPTADLALGVVNAASRALGYGARPQVVVTNTQYIVEVPPKAVSSREWEGRHREVIENV
jgi:hypothetical protein